MLQSDDAAAPAVSCAIIGAQKAGTSSLVRYLGQHPHVSTHETLEFPFFVDDRTWTSGYARAFRASYGPRQPARSCVVAKSVGILLGRAAQVRLHDHNPGVQIVAILRNPVERSYSAYWYMRRSGIETARTFEEAISTSPSRVGPDSRHQQACAYLENSCYADHLAPLLAQFPHTQIHLFPFAQLRKDPQSVCTEIVRAMGLPDYELDSSRRYNPAAVPRSTRLARLMHAPGRAGVALREVLPRRVRGTIDRALTRVNERTERPPPIEAKTQTRLEAYFEGPNARLRTLLRAYGEYWDTEFGFETARAADDAGSKPRPTP